MIALYILLGIILLFVFILFIPITLNIEAGEKIYFSLSVLGIKLFDSSKTKSEKKHKKKDKAATKKSETKKKPNKIKEYFLRQKEAHGTIGAFKEALAIVKVILIRIVWVLKKTEFNNLQILITVASEDAATTAIEYGSVCTGVYPIVSFLNSNARVKLNAVDIKADFNKTKLEYNIKTQIKFRVFYALLGAYYIYKELKSIIGKGNTK